MVPFAKNSLLNGLELLLDVESYDYAVSSTNGEGVIMSILYQLDIPIMKNSGFNLQPGNYLKSFQKFSDRSRSEHADKKCHNVDLYHGR